MQQVERRKRGGDQRKRLLGLLICAVLLAAAVFAVLRTRPEELPETDPEESERRGSLIDRDPEELLKMTIQVRGRDAWTAERGADGKLRLGEDWEMDETLGRRIEDALTNVVYEAVLSDHPAEYREHLADFGLLDPELTAVAEYADGTAATLRFGNAVAPEDTHMHYMLLEGDDRLFAAADSLLEDLRIEPELLRPVVQPEIQMARIDRISVLNGDGSTRIEWQLQGDIYDADAAENWRLTAPFTYPADFDTMVSLKKNAGNLRLGIWIGPATEENLAACGLIRPETVLEIHQARGETGQVTMDGIYDVKSWEESLLRLEIGKERNEMTVFVRFGEEIYSMNRFTLETLTQADPMDSVARYLVPVALEALSSLTVTMDGETTVYRLERESAGNAAESENAEGEETEVRTRCLKNGIEIPYSVFEAAYERMMVVTVSGKLPENPEKRATESTWIFRSVSGKEHCLEFSRYDALHDAVTLDGCTLFYLIREGMGTLP